MSVHESYVLDAPERGRPFDPVAIENDLRTMWKRAGRPGPGESPSIYRAALANLIVPLDPPLGPKLMPVLVEVTRRHPSRLFSIGAGAAAPGERLRARIGAICHRREQGGGGLVCSEQVVLESDPESAGLIPSAIRALRIGDLPTVLLHFHPRLDLPWIAELMEMADLVLVDSCLAEPGREREIWRFLEREGSRRVHDLAWARLTPWRTILSEIFDEKDALEALGTVRTVEIGVTGGERPPPPAWLLAGWLKTRLGWRVTGADREGILLASASGPVSLRLLPLGDGDTRAIERVRIRSGAPHPFEVEILHRGHDHTALVTRRVPLGAGNETPFGYCPFADCIVGEIHRHASNPLFVESARAAEEMMEHGRKP